MRFIITPLKITLVLCLCVTAFNLISANADAAPQGQGGQQQGGQHQGGQQQGGQQGPPSPTGQFKTGDHSSIHDICGGTVNGQDLSVGLSIKIGCKGKGNPIADMIFAVIRALTTGVGIVVVGSIAVGGIQYSASRGDPQATAMAINRIRSSVFALFIFIFGYAFLNYIIPGAILR